jgi:Tol biopolymer transport system component
MPSELPTLEIATEEVPTETPTATQTPSATPSQTPIPPTLELEPPTQPPLPSSTPFPSVAYLNDQWTQIDVPSALAGGLDTNWLAFINFNDRTRAVSSNSTPEPASLTEALYITRPDNRQRVRVADIPVSAEHRVYWSPTGMHVAYFAEASVDENGTPIRGLYMLDFQVGLRYRLFDMENLSPVGIPGHVPVWSPDGRRLAIVLPSGHATDVFLMSADGSNFRNVTNHGSYDLWPAFSPDGLWMAFVSDRVTCPTWTPNEPNTCDRPSALPPTQGNLFIMNLNTNEVRQVTDVPLNGAPRWITSTKLEFSTGGGSALAESSDLWLIDIEAGTAVQVDEAASFSISQTWSPDATRVIYQRTGTSSEIVLADNVGRAIAVTGEYTFPRFGLSSDWSPDGEFLAIGGRNGQCPYGIIVTTPDFEIVTAPARNLLACDPTYAPEGRYLAFTAIRPSNTTDGRLDIYLANVNGLGASNITGNIQGQMQLLGWVGPTPPDDSP